MQMLYEEMDSSLASIYEVVGYFDIKSNEVLSSQCPYLGNPMVLQILCPGKRE